MANNEEWRSINKSLKFEVSNKGRIRNIKGEMVIPFISRCGYKIVPLLEGGKRRLFSVHWLVADNFIDRNRMEKLEIDHKDRNKLNNSVENLRWVTHSVNMKNRDSWNKSSPYKGVYFNKGMNKYQVKVTVNGKLKHIGTFGDVEKAHNEYVKACKKYEVE